MADSFVDGRIGKAVQIKILKFTVTLKIALFDFTYFSLDSFHSLNKYAVYKSFMV